MAKVLALLDNSDRYYDGSVYTDSSSSLFSLVGTRHPYSLTSDEVSIYEGTGYDGLNDNPPGHNSYFVGNGNRLLYLMAAQYGEIEVRDFIIGQLVNVHTSFGSDRWSFQNNAFSDMTRIGYNGTTAFQVSPNLSYRADLDIAFPPNQWKYLEMRIQWGAGDGVFKAWVDGALASSATNVGYGTSKPAIISWFANTMKWNDFYCIIGTDSTPLTDADRLGPIRVDYPGAANASVTSDFLGSDGNSVDNHLLINETLQNWSSTDYVSSSSTGDLDTYRWNLASLSGREVNGAYVESSLRRDDINPISATIVSKSSTDVLARPSITLPLDYTRFGHGFLTQPDGSTWTSTGLTDAEFGVRVND